MNHFRGWRPHHKFACSAHEHMSKAQALFQVLLAWGRWTWVHRVGEKTDVRTLWGDRAQTDRSPLFTSRLFASEHLITTLKKTELVISHHQSLTDLTTDQKVVSLKPRLRTPLRPHKWPVHPGRTQGGWVWPIWPGGAREALIAKMANINWKIKSIDRNSKLNTST